MPNPATSCVGASCRGKCWGGGRGVSGSAEGTLYILPLSSSTEPVEIVKFLFPAPFTEDLPWTHYPSSWPIEPTSCVDIWGIWKLHSPRHTMGTQLKKSRKGAEVSWFHRFFILPTILNSLCYFIIWLIVSPHSEPLKSKQELFLRIARALPSTAYKNRFG